MKELPECIVPLTLNTSVEPRLNACWLSTCRVNGPATPCSPYTVRDRPGCFSSFSFSSSSEGRALLRECLGNSSAILIEHCHLPSENKEKAIPNSGHYLREQSLFTSMVTRVATHDQEGAVFSWLLMGWNFKSSWSNGAHFLCWKLRTTCSSRGAEE